MTNVLNTAVRAKECGHVLATSRDEALIQRMTESFQVLVGLGDTRFELVEIEEGEALAAYLDGLNGCKKCRIVIPGVTS
jgi:hypothetical protein